MSKREALIELVSCVPEHKIRNVYDQIYPILNESIEKDNESITILCCPHCGSVSIKKNGTYNGKQRFICKNCHKSFSTTTDTFMFHNRVSKELWKQFIDYEMDGMTLKDESYHLKLSIHTCFRMRHKLYRAVSSIVENERVTGTVQLDASYTKINLKGTKPKNMPRYSKKRGNGSAYSGISHHKICIVTAIDSMDNMFLKITGLGAESFTKYDSCKYKFEEPTLIVSDSKASIQQFANELGVTNDKIPTMPNGKRYTTNLGNHLGDLNQLDSELSSLITRTHGVSTRFLQDYLNFISYKKQTKYKIDRDKVAEHVYSKVSVTKAFKEEELIYAELPISLKEAYYEYRYGIFA